MYLLGNVFGECELTMLASLQSVFNFQLSGHNGNITGIQKKKSQILISETSHTYLQILLLKGILVSKTAKSS